MTTPNISAHPTTPPNFASGARDAGWFLLDGYDGNRYVESISGHALVRQLQTVLFRGSLEAETIAATLGDSLYAFREGGPWEASGILNRLNPNNYDFSADDVLRGGAADGKWTAGLTAALWMAVARAANPTLRPSPMPTDFDGGTLAVLDEIERTFVERRVNPATLLAAIWVALGSELGLPWSQARRISFGPGTVVVPAWDTSPAAPVDPINNALRIVGVIRGAAAPNAAETPARTPPTVGGTPAPNADQTPPKGGGAGGGPQSGITTTGGKVLVAAASLTALGILALAAKKIRDRYRG